MSAHKLQWSLIKKVLGREVNGYLNVPGFSHSDECTWVFILPIAFLTFPISFWASFENVGKMDSTCPQRTINSWNKLLGNQTYSSIIKANALKSVKPFFFFTHVSSNRITTNCLFQPIMERNWKRMSGEVLQIMIKKIE